MNRIDLIQRLIDEFKYTKYLEIGTQFGNSFLPIRCETKISVDPHFRISSEFKAFWEKSNPTNFNNVYIEQTSSSFFENRSDILQSIRPIDIVLIDGLHTFETSLFDVINCLKYSSVNSLIILHDCLPPNKIAGFTLPELGKFEVAQRKKWLGEWCGDVWKTIVYLRENFSMFLDVFVLNFDYGVGIVKLKNEDKSPITFIKEKYKEVDKLKYEELVNNPRSYLMLTDVSNIDEAIEKVARLF